MQLSHCIISYLPWFSSLTCFYSFLGHGVINDNTPFALSFSLLIFKAVRSKQTALGARGVAAPATRTPSNGTDGLYILSELFVSAKSPPSFDSLCLRGIIY